MWILNICENTFSTEHLRTTASELYYQYYSFKVNHPEHLKYEYSLFKVTRRKPENTSLGAFILNFEQIQYVALSYLFTFIKIIWVIPS